MRPGCLADSGAHFLTAHLEMPVTGICGKRGVPLFSS